MKEIGQQLKKHLLTGISYMIPLVIAGAVIMAIARIGATPFGIKDIWDPKYAQNANALIRILHDFDSFGGVALGLMLPVISAYIAYSIADKPGIAPGLVAGMLAKNLNTGFLGALVSGLIAGYICLAIIKYIKLPPVAASVVPIFILPVFGTLITAIIMNYVLGIPLASLNMGLENWLKSLSGANKILVAAIIGGMVGFDLGGPVNKAAVTTAMALLTSGIYDPNTAAQVAIIVPPIGLGLATFIGKHKYNDELKEAGKASLIMGLVGISEGAIPFVMDDLRLIPINVIGCAIASAMAVGLGAINEAPISGFYGWFAVKSWYWYVLSIAVGSLFIAILANLLRKNETKDM
ncbi:PTS fructose transporter subunit IIC, partial [Thermoanaerobacter thermocopriae]|uniref:PTS fructose transporter subunit IIC n=1 Tax=Thermoanaerobacter thermocopriae TaxID=29350 RepID=UPI0004B22312